MMGKMVRHFSVRLNLQAIFADVAIQVCNYDRANDCSDTTAASGDNH